MLGNMFSVVDLDTEGQKISNHCERQMLNDTRAEMCKNVIIMKEGKRLSWIFQLSF